MHKRSGLIAAAVVAIAVAGCSATGGSSDGGQGFGDRMNALFLGPPAKPDGTAGEQTDVDCPSVDIRQGTSTLTVRGPGEASATNLRYQATIGQTARECALNGGTLTIRVGVQGRVIVGPAGGPGQIDVPVRYALVREGANPQTLYTKLYRVPVMVPPDSSGVNFRHVEQEMSVPHPSQADYDALVVYVGFDQDAKPERPSRKPPPRR